MNTNPFDLDDCALAFASGADPANSYVDGAAEHSRMIADMPAHNHADRDALSCSMLKPMLISPAHFQSSLLQPSTSSDAMDFGSLVHALVLQPHMVGREFAVYPGVSNGRSSEYKTFLAANPERLVVDEPTFAKGRRVADKVLNRKVLGRPFGDFVREGKPESSIYFQEPVTGVMLRIRPDLYHEEATFDLKTTRHATVHAFVRDGVALDYDLQAFMYSLGRSLFDGSESAKPFVFIAAETADPHSCHVVTAGGSFLTNGAKKFQEVMTSFKACTEVGYFPDAGGDATAEIEPWQQFEAKSDWKIALRNGASVH
jgi:exodeoxyribonuclease VIII